MVWGETIIDGHNRWAIIQKHPEIPYTTASMDFPDKWAAIVWMCQNQLGRRSITDEQRAVLIAQEYDAQKKTAGGDRGTERDDLGKFTAGGENRHLPQKSPKTRSVVAKAHGITYGIVWYGKKTKQAHLLELPGGGLALLGKDEKRMKKFLHLAGGLFL